MEELDPDDISRVVLLGLMDGTAKSLEDAEELAAARVINIYAITSSPDDPCWQAAVTTSLLVATRSFGRVSLITNSPDAVLIRGPFRSSTLRDFAEAQSAALLAPTDPHSPSRINISIGDQDGAILGRVLHAEWEGWTAFVGPEPRNLPGNARNVVAAIGAAALAVSEAFLFLLDLPGSDAGHRNVTLDLWMSEQPAPNLTFAPAGWWLVGLGHLGQGYAWVLSHLPYTSPELVEIYLQDLDASSKANYSTSVLTPPDTKTPKTRLVAAAIDAAGMKSRIIERLMNADTNPNPVERGYVALIGVDNLPSRRIETDMGWARTIDAGLGTGPRNFTQISLHSFPGTKTSSEIEAWKQDVTPPDSLPKSSGFEDLARRFEECGVLELAGKAVGVPFVGMTAAVAVVGAALREMNGEGSIDVINLDLREQTIRKGTASSSARSNVPALNLKVEAQ